MPAGRSDVYHRRIEVGGRQILNTRDVLANLFSAVNGSGSIRLDLSHPHAVAVARTYNNQPSGTAGFSNEALPRQTAFHDGESGVVLQQWLPGYRTNVGFAEVAGVQTSVTVAMHDEEGKPLGSEEYVLTPFAQRQINGAALFQNRGRITFAVRGGSVLPYVSTVDGSTGDPIYQTPELPRAARATSLLIPVVARLRGANNTLFRSDVRVYNPTTASQTVTLTLRTTSGNTNVDVTLKAGQTASYDDVIATLFPQLTGDVAGALVVTAPGAIHATSRTFNLTSNGTYGLYVPAREASEGIERGETAYLVQLQSNSEYRCNLGMTSFGEQSVVLVTATDERGIELGSKTYVVPAGQNLQISRIFADIGITASLPTAAIKVTVLDGGTILAYASVNDNRTGDGTYVEAR